MQSRMSHNKLVFVMNECLIPYNRLENKSGIHLMEMNSSDSPRDKMRWVQNTYGSAILFPRPCIGECHGLVG